MPAKKKSLVVYGGWDGHQPKEVAELFRAVLSEEGFDVELSDTLDVFKDEAKLNALSLIVPHWTMGQLTPEQAKPVFAAVATHGVGVAGCHGGMCDAFRNNCEWQFMTGGQWVAHPGNDSVTYPVNIRDPHHPVMEGLVDFNVTSEQYYMHVDPAVRVLASTKFPLAPGPHTPNGTVDMPVVWTKYYGTGRIFYNSIGHVARTLAEEPNLTIMRRGFRWAAR
jgi:type 1 glutamine amidotransferase